jgi:hypothetical protein
MNQHYIPASHIPARFKRESTRHPYKASKCPAEREYKFDGQGGYAKDSHKIPASGWIGGALFCIGFLALCWIGTGVGF